MLIRIRCDFNFICDYMNLISSYAEPLVVLSVLSDISVAVLLWYKHTWNVLSVCCVMEEGIHAAGELMYSDPPLL
jgi:hypothetical protein